MLALIKNQLNKGYKQSYIKKNFGIDKQKILISKK